MIQAQVYSLQTQEGWQVRNTESEFRFSIRIQLSLKSFGLLVIYLLLMGS